jgi:hypothetical protein
MLIIGLLNNYSELFVIWFFEIFLIIFANSGDYFTSLELLSML